MGRTPSPVNDGIVQAVLDLRAKGWGARRISYQLGIGRYTAEQIFSGRYSRKPQPPTDPRGGLVYPHATAPILRCPTCGGRVLSPCFACQLRAVDH